MGNGIVLQLQSEALDESVDIETLLRKAYLVAYKLNLEDFINWIKSEQNGYSGNVPSYRIVGGEIKAWNPYRGWCPVIMPSELSDTVSKMTILNPISTVSDIYNKSEGTIYLSLPGEINELLNKMTDGFPTKYDFVTSKTEFHKIVSAVRNQILDWALKLEESGIIGENLEFSASEIEKAHFVQTINNYTNNFYSTADNTQIEQGKQ